MDDKISKFQEIQVLISLIKNSEKDGTINFNKYETWKDILSVVDNANFAEMLLHKLNSAGIIYFEQVGEDGFKPITMASINANTHVYLEGLMLSVKDDYESLERRITEILTFNPAALSKSILETRSKIDEVSKILNENELLKPLAEPLGKIKHHFESVSVVSSSYEEVYKNIIKPVQDEGRSGVKATVRWAIISIILSTLLSLVIGNWSDISKIISSAA